MVYVLSRSSVFCTFITVSDSLPICFIQIIQIESTFKWTKNLATSPNLRIQVFSAPFPGVYKIKHLSMQSVFTTIYERMGHYKELTEFLHGTVIGCYYCSKSVSAISSLLPTYTL